MKKKAATPPMSDAWGLEQYGGQGAGRGVLTHAVRTTAQVEIDADAPAP